MKKKNYSQEIEAAEEVLSKTESNVIWKKQGEIIAKGINGLVAAFSVSIATIGLLPAAMYYYSDEKKRRPVLELVAKTYYKILEDTPRDPAKALLEDEIRVKPADAALRQRIVDCAIGLKYIVRTYDQESNQ